MAAACRLIVATLGKNGSYCNNLIRIVTDTKSLMLFVDRMENEKSVIEVSPTGDFLTCDAEQVYLVPEVKKLVEQCLTS